ncbi:hypothetical protein DYU05_07175 [Mucilaginibacter terrenus]|uniref:Uncharacterized protein n=1 Tax=Mucilaginibacter terrenus TaxID=2482727 RepID=A0A3E2NWK8_9SPHI|nr:hypothetical protein [Mucilaginibacter terrenus]RFZ85372.1 hypothetical protein DYU05_07175 [Mucilaginibacter terrenus]
MVFIKRIEFMDDYASEACVTISDGLFELIVFKHPFKFEKIEVDIHELTALHSDKIYRANTYVYSIKKLDGFFEYELTGLVIDRQKDLVRVGEFVIELDGIIPGDILEGEFVSCRCGRIDC